MEYHCLGYLEPGKFEGMTDDERNEVFDECFEHNDHLRANGHLVAEVAPQHPQTAATSRRPTAPMRRLRRPSGA